MADPHVISALREKRALVAGLIEKLERKLEQHRADLTHIDGVLRLFQPDRDPGEIKPRRTYARRTRYFARNELSRLCMDVLRAADGELMTTAPSRAGSSNKRVLMPPTQFCARQSASKRSRCCDHSGSNRQSSRPDSGAK